MPRQLTEVADGPASNPTRSPRPRRVVKALSVLVSAALLLALYRGLDVSGVGRALRAVDVWWLALAIGLIGPITLLRALRFRWLLPPGSRGSVAEAVRITLVASALNVFLPAKTGDFAKSLIVSRRGAAGGIATAIIVFERLSDTAGIVFWGLLGVIAIRSRIPVVPPATWYAFAALGLGCMCAVLSERIASWFTSLLGGFFAPERFRRLTAFFNGWPDLLISLRGRRVSLLLFSVFLWFVQLLQVWLFAVSLSADLSFALCAAVSSIALFFGQIPGTLSGIGARDMALVFLLSAYIGPEKAAALGILTATRTIVPALLALPTLRSYLGVMVHGADRDRQES